MKILIHSNGPMVPSGYGQQVALLLPALAELGHEPAVSAFHGVTGSPIDWNGFTIFPSGQHAFGVDVIADHARTFGADLVLFLMDVWKLAPVAGQLRELKTAAWIPNDCRPLGRGDREVLAVSRTLPIALSRWGLENLRQAGWKDALYVPHMVDTTLFTPPQDRLAARESAGVADRFVIGICAANRDAVRKAWPEQFRAFALFRREHPEALLWVHSVVHSAHGFDLQELAQDMGIADAVQFSEDYPQVAGLLPPEALAPWYGCLDLLSNCSYAEAFGIPLIEAQACGTPVVATRGSAMTELAEPAGWTVLGEEFWNHVHHAWWTRPRVKHIRTIYERACGGMQTSRPAAKTRERARGFAVRYGIDRVVPEFWKPALDVLEGL